MEDYERSRSYTTASTADNSSLMENVIFNSRKDWGE
jgi:hypothetical protein